MNEERSIAVSTSRREQKLGELFYLMGLLLDGGSLNCAGSGVYRYLTRGEYESADYLCLRIRTDSVGCVLGVNCFCHFLSSFFNAETKSAMLTSVLWFIPLKLATLLKVRANFSYQYSESKI